jgi:hypothetical protein
VISARYEGALPTRGPDAQPQRFRAVARFDVSGTPVAIYELHPLAPRMEIAMAMLTRRFWSFFLDALLLAGLLATAYAAATTSLL